MLVQNDVVVDPVLSNVSVRFNNPSYIAPMIMPLFPVQKQTGKYYKYDKANLRIPETARAIGSPSNEVEYGLTTSSFSCEDHALKGFVPDEVRDQADTALSPLIDETENVTDRLMNDSEKALATTMADTGTITQNTTLSGTDQWNDYTNSEPIADIRTGISTVKGATGKRPNTVILGWEVFNDLQDHPAIVERVKYSQLGVVTADLLARVFDVETVLIGDALENTADEGQSDSLGYVWGKHAWVGYISRSKRLKQCTFGWTFTYENRQTTRWRDEDRKGTYVRTNWNYDQSVVSAETMYLIKDAVA